MTGDDKQKLVLAIDDDPRSLMLMSIILGKAGYRITTAEDGCQGLAALSAERPDIVLVDLMMPRMDGLEFCRHVRRQQNLENLPLVLATATASDDVRQQALAAGANAVLTKPFERAALLTHLDRLLDHS